MREQHAQLGAYYRQRITPEVPSELLSRTCHLAFLHEMISTHPEHRALLLRLRPFVGQPNFRRLVLGVVS